MIAAIHPTIDFAALVEGKADIAEFDPLVASKPVVAFRLLSAEPNRQEEASEGTYRHIKPPAPAVGQDLTSVLSERDQEIERLKNQLLERQADFEQIRTRLEEEAAGRENAAHDALWGHILESLSTIEQRINADLSRDLARILEPFLTEQIRQRAIDEFGAAIDKCMTGGELTNIRISGPPGLIAAFRLKCADRLPSCEWIEEETVDIIAELNGKLVATRLDHWFALLSGHVR
ncbi:MAG: hypothetical protein WAT78_04710 [Rhizobiaceae bacterium]